MRPTEGGYLGKTGQHWFIKILASEIDEGVKLNNNLVGT